MHHSGSGAGNFGPLKHTLLISYILGCRFCCRTDPARIKLRVLNLGKPIPGIPHVKPWHATTQTEVCATHLTSTVHLTL